MSYQEAVRYLESRVNLEKVSAYPYNKLIKLERISEFLNLINNPQSSLKCIHVAGSKGKGSTCAFIAYILREAGFKTGLYTSPHLYDFRERIRILNPRVKTKDPFEGMISKTRLSSLVKRFKPLIREYNRTSKYGPLTFFEVYTVLAFVYFKEEKTDLVVLETGLGGRLDATNVVNALVCAIAPISYEHTDKLGRTLSAIAQEKAGIIKKLKETRAPIVVSAPQKKEAGEVIRNKCKMLDAKLHQVGRDIKYSGLKVRFNISSLTRNYRGLKISLSGSHQLINASVALGVIEALGSFGINVSPVSVRNGLYNTLWPGRIEVLSRHPYVVLDGAQNIASANVLKKAIKGLFHYKKLILILGVSRDKDIRGICRELYDLADTVILTCANTPRATEPKIMARYFKGKELRVTENISAAKKLAEKVAGAEDLILVTGSLFVVGEFRAKYDKKRFD